MLWSTHLLAANFNLSHFGGFNWERVLKRKAPILLFHYHKHFPILLHSLYRTCNPFYIFVEYNSWARVMIKVWHKYKNKSENVLKIFLMRKLVRSWQFKGEVENIFLDQECWNECTKQRQHWPVSWREKVVT